MEEVLSEEDFDENRFSSHPVRLTDVFLTRVQSPSGIVSSRSPITVSSRPSSRLMLGTANSSSQLADENRFLNDELNRVETVLNLTRAEKDELSIRYNALSDRVRTNKRS